MIRILSDSGCDLPKEILAQKEIITVPLNLALEDGRLIKDGLDMTGDEFFTHMQACEKLPKTSQPTPDAFAEVFADAKSAGDEVVAIMISKELSGTYQSARIGAQIADFENVHLVDSQTICAGFGLLVLLAAKLRDEGKTALEIVEVLERAKTHLHLFAVVDNLQYLRKGGRLPAAVAVAGGMLGIKPIITIKNGKVALGGKARGLPGAYVALFKKIDEAGGINTELPLACGYSLSKKEVEPICRFLAKNPTIPEPTIVQIGSAIGTHAGPGCFGFAFFDANFTDF